MRQPILVPLDGSDLAEQALPYAQTLAGSGCQRILLEVGQEGDTDLPALERHANSDARLETANGDPAEQILRVARDLNAGMIVMTTHGRGALGRFVFGSVADAVTRRSPVPVFVVHPRAEDGSGGSSVIRRLLVPLDGSARAEEAIPLARDLAEQLHLPIQLISVVDTVSLIPVEVVPVVAFDPAVYEETVTKLDAGATTMMTTLSQRLRDEGFPTDWELRHGSPSAAILDAVQPGDVIVMASHGHGGAKRLLLGSVAEHLIRHGRSPVLLVPAAERPNNGTALERADQLGASAVI